ncbi:MAG: HD domain-containing protein, partial [Solobacterium sp.]|nr:HD domain-containing protein [Solobacterium sp.]
MVESRDQCTGDHVRKTAAYCRIILEQLRKDGLFTDLLTDEYIDDVVNSAPLHDIGKIKVSDAILNKPGKLTDEEFEEMKKHTLAGNEIIQQAMELVSSDTGYLREAKNLATYHHEKWNGKGYPMGLAGEDIPLSARVMAVADVFDALVSRRSYKEPFSFEKAMSIIDEGSGNHFDPRVVKAFDEVKDQAKEISERHLGHSTEVVNPLPESGLKN